MKKVFAICLLLIGLAVAVTPVAYAHGAEDIVITGVWARPTATSTEEATPNPDMAAMGAVSAVYMHINNPGGHPISLIGGSTAVAEVVEIHQTTMDANGVMQMNPVDGGIIVPAGESASLEPGGYHVMLLNVTEPLIAGEAFKIVLTFAMLENDGTSNGNTLEIPVAALISDEAPLPLSLTINASEVWARPTVADAEEAAPVGAVSAVYLTIANPTDAEDTLLSAGSPVADAVELHETSMDANSVMQMNPVDGGIIVPVGEAAVFAPGGYHIMLVDVQVPLVSGDAIALELTFASGESTTLAVLIEDRLGGEDHEHAEGEAAHNH